MITILKLSNGVEVVGTEVVEDAVRIILNKPLQINYRYFQSSIPNVSFARYIMFAKSDDIQFDKRDIVNRVVARPAFAGYYTNVVDQYYEVLEQILDKELSMPDTQTDPYERLLETMSIDGVAVN